MANKHQKLELTWIGKGIEPKLEPRILIEDPAKSYGKLSESKFTGFKDKKNSPLNHPVKSNNPENPDSDNWSNMLIHGDNLLALKALEQDFAGKIKCIYIDPPYNTGNAFEHYDDGVEHSLWLSLMKPRLELLNTLLKNDGSIWVTLDDNEVHYCKVLCDEIFGRSNFVANVVWQKRIQPDMRATIGAGHDHILVYAKCIEDFKKGIKLLPSSNNQIERYTNPDNDPNGPWVSADYMAKGFRPNQMYEITTPSGKKYIPRTGSCWRNIEPVFLELQKQGKIWFGVNGDSVPRKKTYLSELNGISAWTWWPNSEVGHNQEAKKEINKLFGNENAFETPKPERLILRIIQLTTNEKDIVLDSFLGSGTTVAVAHKMNRRWIGIELGEHAVTHCLPRLQKVVDGTDKGGITEAVNWQGGGGFKFYTLAPSLLKQDQYGNWVITEEYNADMLAAAMAKQEGFRYQPHESIYWKQGQSSEKDFIFTTTQFVTVEILNRLHDEMQPGESLLICCRSFKHECESRFANITIKKIPQMLLGRCEFGKNDYSLNIVNIPLSESEFSGLEDEQDKDNLSVQQIDTVDNMASKKVNKQQKKSSNEIQGSLF